MRENPNFDFFDPDPAFSFTETQPEAKGMRPAASPIRLRFVASAALAAAISTFSAGAASAQIHESDLVISAAAIEASVTTMAGDDAQHPITNVPSVDLLAGVEGGRKALLRATRVLETADDLGLPPDRVAPMADGSVAIYWLSASKMTGGGSKRLAMFECAKDGIGLLLSDRADGSTETFDLKPTELRSFVERAVAYVA